jgi:hypothetical protein
MRSRTRFFIVAAALLAAGTLWAQQQDRIRRGMGAPGQRGVTTQPAGPMGQMCQMHMQMMADLKDTLSQARQAADAGDSKTASQKIGQAQQLIDQQHARMHEMMKGRMGQGIRGAAGMKCPICGETMGPDQGEVSNRICPMDDSKIDPAKLTAGATREYKGEKIGFCCAGCAQMWDRLSDEQKREKMEIAQRQTEGDATTGR